MIKKFALFLFLFICILPKVRLEEACESYTSYGFYNEAQNCSDYCCGSCTARYCCDDRYYRIDQQACVKENCTAYYDYWGVYNYARDCTIRYVFCCGSCDDRYCCSSPPYKLNQTVCPNVSPTTRKTTKPNYNNNDNNLSALYWSVGFFLVFFIISCIGIAYLRYLNKKRQQFTTRENMSYYRHSTNSGYPTNNAQRSAFVVADNSAYNYDINKIYNTNINDDFPPSYDTINVQQKKTKETNETNLDY